MGALSSALSCRLLGDNAGHQRRVKHDRDGVRIVQPRLVRKVGLSRDDEVRRGGDGGLIAASESHGAALHPHDDDLVQRPRDTVTTEWVAMSSRTTGPMS